MIAVLALLVAQATAPATDPPPAPSATASLGSGLAAPGATPDDAVVSNSGSTNALGFTLVIRRDGSTDVFQRGHEARGTLARPQTAWLFAKLDAAGPVSAIAIGRCMRSMSFGSITRVAFHGSVSGDLGCALDTDGRELKRTIGVIAAQLGLDTASRRRLAPL